MSGICVAPHEEVETDIVAAIAGDVEESRGCDVTTLPAHCAPPRCVTSLVTAIHLVDQKSTSYCPDCGADARWAVVAQGEEEPS